jgi:hypothetical protein
MTLKNTLAQTQQATQTHSATPEEDIHQAAVDTILKASLFFDLLFNDPEHTFVLLFLIGLSFKRHPIVLPDPGSSASKLVRK